MSAALSVMSFALAVVLYAIAATLFYLEVARSKSTEQRAIAPVLLGVAAFSHGGYVMIASFIAHVCPVHSVHFILSIASLLATTTYLIARRRFRMHALGLIVAPLGLVFTLGTYFLGTAGPEAELPASFIGLHVFANLAGEALFLLACAAAVMYIVQERQLKSKRMIRGKGLPPLDSLDKAVHRFLLIGFPLLTVGLITGTTQAGALELGRPEAIARSVLGYASWLLIALVLLLRVIAGWRGRRSAYGTVAGFACSAAVLLIYLLRPVGG